jgi:DNA-binding transcriptional LysR family regulator
MTFNNVELQILVGLAANKTLAEIGEPLYMLQPAVSRALRAAEARAGLQLTERSGRRLILTAAGEEIARSAQRIISQLNEVDDLVQRLQQGESGTLRIVAANTPANYIIPQVLSKFANRFPDVDIKLRAASTADLWTVFLDERYDVAVAPDPAVPSHWPAELLYEDELVLFVSPDFPLASSIEVALSDLSSHTLIGPFFQAHWADMWSRLAAQGLSGQRRIDVMASEAVKRLVEAGGGVGMLYRSAIAREDAEGTLVVLPCPEISERLRYVLVQRHTHRPLPVTNGFCAMLREMFRPSPASRPR